jgi:hypothetical protein
MPTLLLSRKARTAALAAVFALGAFGVGLAPSADGDIFWHLAAGREMVATRAFIHENPFAVSGAGRPWIDVHWLFELAVYGVHSVVGLAGLVLAKCALIAGSALLLFELVRRRAGERALLPFAVTFLTALFFARHLLLLRPVIGTLAMLSVFVTVLELSRGAGRERWLLALPPLQIVWANLQGLSALGPALVLCYAAGAALAPFGRARAGLPLLGETDAAGGEARRARFLGATLLACGGAMLVTPYGLDAVALPFRLLARLTPGAENVFSTHVVENAPPLALDRKESGDFWHLRFYLAFALVAFAVRPRRLRLSQGLLVAVFTALAVLAARNVLLLYWVATPVLVENLMPKLRRLGQMLGPRRGLVLGRVAGAAALVGVLGFVGTAFAREASLDAPTPFRLPTRSAETLEKAPAGTIFSADHYGGYLIWKLHPEHRPYIDTRLILRTPEEFSEFLDVVDHPERFDAFERRHGFEYVLLPTAYPARYLGLVARLYASDRWRLLDTDGAEVLFARRRSNGEPSLDLGASVRTDAITADLDGRFASSPELLAAARTQLAALDMAVGELDQAERVLGGTTSPEADALLARCRLARGDYAAAAAIADRLLESTPDDVQTLNVSALAALARGEPRAAADALGRALRHDPFDPEARKILSQLEDPSHVETH